MEFTWTKSVLLPVFFLMYMYSNSVATPVALVHVHQLAKRDIPVSISLSEEPDEEIRCILHHEFAVFVHPDELSNFEPRGGTVTSQIPSLQTFINRNGKTKHYFCSPCSQCGEGVRILAQCHLRQDTVCSTICLDPEWIYDEQLKRCFPTRHVGSVVTTIAASTKNSTSHLVTVGFVSWATTSRFFTEGIKYISSVGNSGLNDAENEKEHKKGNKWTKEIIPITVGVLTLNIMFAILLIWKQREWRRKKDALNRIQRDQERRERNNRLSTSRTVSQESNRPESLHAVVDIEPPASSVPCINRDADSVLCIPDRDTCRVKESNLNQFVVNYTPGIESHTDVSTIVQCQTNAVPEIKVNPGTNPYWIEMSSYIGPEGGEISCDQSDVVIQIPSRAIPSSQAPQLIIVKVSRTPGIFPVELTKEAMFLSPLIDCESPGLKQFEKDVVIKLPHRAHLGPDWQFMVHHTTGSYTGEVDSHWNTVKSSCREARRDLQNTAHDLNRPANAPIKSEVQFTIDEKYVHITTPHFSKYTCSGCGKRRELSLEAVVYVNDIQLEFDRRVDLHCYLLDGIKDFQSKVNYNEPYRPRSEHKPLIINAKRGKELEVSLMDMKDSEDWPWKADERIHKTTQIVHLDNIVRCHSDVVPNFVTFTLRQRYPRADDNVRKEDQSETVSRNAYLEAAVSIKQKSQDHGITLDIALNLDAQLNEEHNAFQGTVNETSLEEIFSRLSTKITAREFRPLYRSLMTTASGCPLNVEAGISFIENKDPHDVREQIYQGFLKWLSVSGKHATVKRLCESLRRVELVALAEEIEDRYDQPNVKTTTKIDETDPLLSTEDLHIQDSLEVVETDV